MGNRGRKTPSIAVPRNRKPIKRRIFTSTKPWPGRCSQAASLLDTRRHGHVKASLSNEILPLSASISALIPNGTVNVSSICPIIEPYRAGIASGLVWSARTSPVSASRRLFRAVLIHLCEKFSLFAQLKKVKIYASGKKTYRTGRYCNFNYRSNPRLRKEKSP